MVRTRLPTGSGRGSGRRRAGAPTGRRLRDPGRGGRVGGVLAHHLAAAGSTVVLLGRGDLGDRQRQALAEIDSRGGTGVYLRADASDPAALRAAKQEIVERFGAVHGIVHSAIVLRDQTLRAMDEDTFLAALSPKTRGSVAFCAEFADQPLDFVLFFSSVQSFVGSGGQGNYAAACAFQDAYARHLRALGQPVTVLNWGYWGSVGVVATRRTGSASPPTVCTPSSRPRGWPRCVSRWAPRCRNWWRCGRNRRCCAAPCRSWRSRS
ncbi:ketoreductase domain-containing protein, partial [Micromonospora tarensis]|uniref:ketoreductase domain-containing protein n=1 Tax=Micromonospora tarensis TaxID=2806100 RepID=UPI00210696AE